MTTNSPSVVPPVGLDVLTAWSSVQQVILDQQQWSRHRSSSLVKAAVYTSAAMVKQYGTSSTTIVVVALVLVLLVRLVLAFWGAFCSFRRFLVLVPRKSKNPKKGLKRALVVVPSTSTNTSTKCLLVLVPALLL